MKRYWGLKIEGLGYAVLEASVTAEDGTAPSERVDLMRIFLG